MWSFYKILHCTVQKIGQAHKRSFAILYIIIIATISVGSLFSISNLFGSTDIYTDNPTISGTIAASRATVNTTSAATVVDNKSAAIITPKLTLVSQSPWISTSQTFHLTFGLSYTEKFTGISTKRSSKTKSSSTSSNNLSSLGNLPSLSSLPAKALQNLQVSVSLYDRLTSQSAFQSTLSHISNDSILSTSGGVPLDVLPHNGNDFELSIILNGTTTHTAPNIIAFNLPCTSGSTPCHGVYPLQLTLENTSASNSSSSSSPLSTLDTYLTYVHTTPAFQPLRISYIAPLSMPLTFPASSTSATKHATSTYLQSLASDISSIKNSSPIPVTIQLEPFALQQLACTSNINTNICYSNVNKHPSTQTVTLARNALQSLESMSLLPRNEILSGPYVPINIDRLAAGSLENQIHNQLEEGNRILSAVHIHTYNNLWLEPSPLTNQAALALKQQGITNIVLSSSDLNSQYTNLTLTNPFTLNLNNNSSVLGYPIDSSSRVIMNQMNSTGPILSAYDLIANFSMVYFEAPYQSTARGVIAYGNPNSSLLSQFTSTLFQLLNENPILRPVTFSQYVTQVPPSTGPAANRSLSSNSATTAHEGMPTALHNAILNSYKNLQAFRSSFENKFVFNKFYDTFLCSMGANLSAHFSESELSNLRQAIMSYISNLSLISDRTITITSSKTTIPITILSRLHYPVNTLLELSSSGIDAGKIRKQKVTIDHATTVVYVPVTVRATGYFHIKVKLLSMNGQMSLASTDLPVRSAAISIIAIILSAGAILVLLGWWLHTLHLRHKADSRRPQHLRTN